MQFFSYTLFLGTLIFAPLAFGSVETWSIAIVESLVFLTSLICFFETRHTSKPLLEVPGIFPLFLLTLFIWFQLIPLPPAIVHFISPSIYDAYFPILNIQENNFWIPLTVNQKSTLLEGLRITSYAFFYIITVQLLSHKEFLTKTVQIVTGLAIVIAFLAILQKFTSPDLIYWFRAVPGNTHPVGPWIYRNHYAGFMELLFPLVLALFFYYRPNFHDQQSFRSKAVSMLSAPGSNVHFFLGFSVILILTSIFIGLSRGGIIATNISFFLFLILLTKKSTHSGKILPFVIFCCVLLATTWFGWEPILARFNTITTETGSIVTDRFPIWMDCIPLVKDFFLTGSGFGTFIHVFSQYNNLPASTVFDHAHNDYLELITDGGLIGFFLAAWFVVTIFRNGIKQLSIRRESYSILLIIGALTASFSILIHSITDFNMHNGANGLYFFFVCGVLISAGNTRLHYRNKPTLLKESPPIWKLTYLIALPLFLLVVSVQGGIFKAKQQHKQASKIYLNPLLSKQILQDQLIIINKAIHLDPREGLYSSYKGNLLSYLRQNEASLKHYLQASQKDPLEGAYLQRIGLLLPPDKHEQASFLISEGAKRGLNKDQLLFVSSEWHLQQGKREKALAILKQGAELFPDIAKNLPSFILFYNFSREEIVSILPPKTPIWITLGKFMEKAGQIEDSEFYRSHALDFLNRKETIHPSYFVQLYSFYRRQKRTVDSINTLRLGLKWLPEYVPFHIYLGDYYKQQNILYRAKEEYEQALMLEPGNQIIKQRLQNIK